MVYNSKMIYKLILLVATISAGDCARLLRGTLNTPTVIKVPSVDAFGCSVKHGYYFCGYSNTCRSYREPCIPTHFSMMVDNSSCHCDL